MRKSSGSERAWFLAEESELRNKTILHAGENRRAEASIYLTVQAERTTACPQCNNLSDLFNQAGWQKYYRLEKIKNRSNRDSEQPKRQQQQPDDRIQQKSH